MGSREDRIALNEALFRDVNERVRNALDEMNEGMPPEVLEIFCECGLGDCMEKIRVSLQDYERTRAHSEQFLVAIGHVIPHVESLVRDAGAYEVVEKHAHEAQIARATDPRS